MIEQPTVLDLFSGIGGFSLGLDRAGFKTASFCEIEPFCRKVLSKHWPHVPIARDIRKLQYSDGSLYDAERIIYEGRIDLVCGGFPCQPFSVAGQKKGTQDDRDLWPEMFRIIQQTQPSWVIGENVANFVNLAFARTKVDLESEGYTVQSFIIPACAIGAPHRRDRVWIIANSSGKRCWPRGDYREGRQVSHNQDRNAKKNQQEWEIRKCGINQVGEVTSNNDGKRIQGIEQKSFRGQQAFSWCKDVRRIEDYFNRPSIPQPLFCGGRDGVPDWVDRLKGLGNAVVPQIPEIIGKAIIDTYYKTNPEQE